MLFRSSKDGGNWGIDGLLGYVRRNAGRKYYNLRKEQYKNKITLVKMNVLATINPLNFELRTNSNVVIIKSHNSSNRYQTQYR